MDTQELIRHPVTALAVVVSTIGQFGFGWFEPLWGLIASTAGIWFPAIAVSASEIFPQIGLGDIGPTVLLAAAIVFVAVQLDRLADRVAAYLDNR